MRRLATLLIAMFAAAAAIVMPVAAMASHGCAGMAKSAVMAKSAAMPMPGAGSMADAHAGKDGACAACDSALSGSACTMCCATLPAETPRIARLAIARPMIHAPLPVTSAGRESAPPLPPPRG